MSAIIAEPISHSRSSICFDLSMVVFFFSFYNTLSGFYIKKNSFSGISILPENVLDKSSMLFMYE